MDPETAKAWAPVVAAAIGGFIGGFSAFFVARANIRGQQQMARDAALRQWRVDRLHPLLELTSQRLTLYDALVAAASTGQGGRATEVLNELQRLAALQATAVSLRLVGSDELRIAIDGLVSADARSRDAIARLVEMSGSTTPLAGATIRNVLEKTAIELQAAIAIVHLAAEGYLFPDSARTPQPLLIQITRSLVKRVGLFLRRWHPNKSTRTGGA